MKNLSSKAVDIVYQCVDGQTRKRIIFSLKDVRVPYISGFPKPTASWESVWDASSSLIRTDAHHIRSLKVNYPSTIGPVGTVIPPPNTVGDVEERCVKELQDKYLPELQLDSKTEGEVVAFALTRVGIHRVLASKVLSVQ